MGSEQVSARNSHVNLSFTLDYSEQTCSQPVTGTIYLKVKKQLEVSALSLHLKANQVSDRSPHLSLE